MRHLNEGARVVSISLDDYAMRGWAQTFQSLVPVDLPIAADAALTLPALVAAVEDRLRRDPMAAGPGRSASARATPACAPSDEPR